MNYPATKPQLTEAQLNSPLRRRDIEWISKGFAQAIKVFVAAETTPLRKRIEELEQRPTVKYFGTFEQGRVYTEGSMVTDHGSCWYAKRATMERPGSDDSWVLAVKRGKDGNDGPRTATSQRGPR